MEDYCPYCGEKYWRIYVRRPFVVSVLGRESVIYFDNISFCRFCKKNYLTEGHIRYIDAIVVKDYGYDASWREK
jgi:uncharacterized protein with PIN domain